MNLRLFLRKRARPGRGGLSETGEDGWIIELGAKVCPLGLGMDEPRLGQHC